MSQTPHRPPRPVRPRAGRLARRVRFFHRHAAAKKPKKVPLISLKSGTTTIAPDPGFVAALGSASVTPTVLPPGELTDAGFAFPVISGKLLGNKPAAGIIRHFGGLRLSLPNGDHIDLNNFRINDGKTATVTAQIGSGVRVAIATLDVEDATIKLTKKRFVLANVSLLATDVAAQALNAQFNTTAFSAGQKIGTATVDAKVRIELKKLKKKS